MAAHCRSWVGPDGAKALMDLRMMFGCRAAANWAQRGTGMVTWLLQQAMDLAVFPGSNVEYKQELLRRAGIKESEFKAAYVSCFIDDQTWLSVQSRSRAMMAVAAALWKVLGLEPQGKKVWHEGCFETK